MLADGLRRRGIEPSSPPDAVDVVFVSHAEHGPFLHQLWSGTRAGERAITFVATPSPPHAATVLKGSEAHSRETVEATLRPPAHLQACIDAYRLPDGGRRLRLLVANLFALEAVHLAEALDVPLVMAHPYPAPCPAPAAFARQFRRVDPLGYNMLRQAGPGTTEDDGVDDLMHA